MKADNPPIDQLIELSRELGREDRRLAILGEGNTSTRASQGTFIVKASGSNLGELDAGGITECHSAPLLALLDRSGVSDDEVDAALFESRVNRSSRKPSVEAVFHAWLLTLPEVNFVGHTHPVTVNSLLCSGRGADLAARRIFPDEIVCCGPASVLVPYLDPGIALARGIRAAVTRHRDETGLVPRVILLESHGLIAIGATAKAVLATTLMTDKASAVTLGAYAAGRPNYLSEADIARIAGRSDEHYRQKALGM